MTSIPEIDRVLKNVLGAIDVQTARETGFTKRESKLTATKFGQTLVLGWLHNPDATLDELSQAAADVGVEITPQGIDERFGPEAAALLERILSCALSQVVYADDPVAIPLLRRFNGVMVHDSSVVALPDALAQVWQGCGGSGGHGSSALKLDVCYDMLRGSLCGPQLRPGRSSDRASTLLEAAPLEPGALRLTDLGFFALGSMGELDAEGILFLSRLLLQTGMFDLQGNRLDLATILLAQECDGQVDREVQIGVIRRLRVRLLAQRVPPEVAQERRRKVRADAKHKGEKPSQVRLAFADWIILVTNVPEEKLSVAEAMVLMGVRWQVELLFKLWKQYGKIDEWRTKKPWRILCETYAKLTAMIIQHWLILVGCWHNVKRSLVKAAKIVRKYAPMLARGVAGYDDLAGWIEQICRCMARGCRMDSRREYPNTYQLLLDLSEVP